MKRIMDVPDIQIEYLCVYKYMGRGQGQGQGSRTAEYMVLDIIIIIINTYITHIFVRSELNPIENIQNRRNPKPINT